MAEDSKAKVYRVLKVEDLKFISGGANVKENIDGNHLQTSRTHRCNCGGFSPMNTGVCLDICDNCKFAVADSEDPDNIHCCIQNK